MTPEKAPKSASKPPVKSASKSAPKSASAPDEELQSNPNLESILSNLWAARQMKKTAESLEQEAKSQLGSMVDAVADRFPDAALIAGPWRIKRTTGASVRIDGPTLLERGVDPAIITEATVRTEYYQYRLTQLLNGEGTDAA